MKKLNDDKGSNVIHLEKDYFKKNNGKNKGKKEDEQDRKKAEKHLILAANKLDW